MPPIGKSFNQFMERPYMTTMPRAILGPRPATWLLPMTKLVILESPYSGDVQLNLSYARACLRHSLEHDEAPLASHLLYTQVLDDEQAPERRWGIMAGHSWMRVAELVAVYTDLGISTGMIFGINVASQLGVPVEFRALGGTSWAHVPAMRSSHD